MNKNFKDLVLFILIVISYWLIIWMLPTSILYFLDNEYTEDAKTLYLLGSIFLTILLVGSSLFFIGKNIIERKK